LGERAEEDVGDEPLRAAGELDVYAGWRWASLFGSGFERAESTDKYDV
jgi:hypothetical protein